MAGQDTERALCIVTRDGFAAILDTLRADGYQLVGPTVSDGAITHAPIGGVEDLPVGWTEQQDAGRYRLERRADDALFGYAVGPHSWKPQFFAPRVRLFRARRTDDGVTFEAEDVAPPKLAIVGARACDLHAIAIQDRVFLDGPFADTDYAARRRGTFVIAVNCTDPGGACFCVSMNTGPRATTGFDLAMTELPSPPHRFVVTAGSERGRALLARVPTAPAPEHDVREADGRVDSAARTMGRTLDTTALPELLARNLEHPQWDDVAERCLACTNCTLVCPTCFCASVEDSSDVGGTTAERWRRWDSCFTLGHSHVHGGSVRRSVRARYRQWLTHKLSTWVEQFGTSGCVGCGRCLTWCPVAIDLTREVAAIRATDGATTPGRT